MVKVYATKDCPYCTIVEKYLNMKSVEYEKIYVDDDMDTRQWLIEKTNMMSVPITMKGDDWVVGWDAGKLAKLIA